MYLVLCLRNTEFRNDLESIKHSAVSKPSTCSPVSHGESGWIQIASMPQAWRSRHRGKGGRGRKPSSNKSFQFRVRHWIWVDFTEDQSWSHIDMLLIAMRQYVACRLQIQNDFELNSPCRVFAWRGRRDCQEGFYWRQSSGGDEYSACSYDWIWMG